MTDQGYRTFLTTILITLLLISSRTSAADKNIEFQRDIAPILQKHCLGCHQDRVRQGGLALHSAVEIYKGGESGEIIDPGDPDSSYLMDLLTPPGRGTSDRRRSTGISTLDQTGCSLAGSPGTGASRLMVSEISAAPASPCHRTTILRVPDSQSNRCVCRCPTSVCQSSTRTTGIETNTHSPSLSGSHRIIAVTGRSRCICCRRRSCRLRKAG